MKEATDFTGFSQRQNLKRRKIKEDDGDMQGQWKLQKNVNLCVLRRKHWLWQMGIVFEGEKRKKEGLKSKVVRL